MGSSVREKGSRFYLDRTVDRRRGHCHFGRHRNSQLFEPNPQVPAQRGRRRHAATRLAAGKFPRGLLDLWYCILFCVRRGRTTDVSYTSVDLSFGYLLHGHHAGRRGRHEQYSVYNQGRRNFSGQAEPRHSIGHFLLHALLYVRPGYQRRRCYRLHDNCGRPGYEMSGRVLVAMTSPHLCLIVARVARTTFSR